MIRFKKWLQMLLFPYSLFGSVSFRQILGISNAFIVPTSIGQSLIFRGHFLIFLLSTNVYTTLWKMVPDLAMAKVVKRQQWLRGNIWSLGPLKLLFHLKVMLGFPFSYLLDRFITAGSKSNLAGWLCFGDEMSCNRICLVCYAWIQSTFWRTIFYPCHTSVSCCFLYILLWEHNDFYKQLTYFSICLEKISANIRSLLMNGSFRHYYHYKIMTE